MSIEGVGPEWREGVDPKWYERTFARALLRSYGFPSASRPLGWRHGLFDLEPPDAQEREELQRWLAFSMLHDLRSAAGPVADEFRLAVEAGCDNAKMLNFRRARPDLAFLVDIRLRRDAMPAALQRAIPYPSRRKQARDRRRASGRGRGSRAA